MKTVGIVIIWVVLRIGGFGLLLFPLWLANHFAENFGPVLQSAVLFGGIATTVLTVAAIYTFARGNPVRCWRIACLAVAIPFLTLVYCRTGDRPFMDRTMAFANAESGLRNIKYGAMASQEERTLWRAEVLRDYEIAKAHKDYDATVRRFQGGSGIHTMPMDLIIATVVGIFFCAASFAPRTWVEEACDDLTA